MKRLLLFLILIIFTTIDLTGDVWYYHPDPELNQGDWRSEEYYYYDWEAYGVNETITSPFFQYEATHLNSINQGVDADFQPEDGWNLYAANFGEQAGTGSGFPLFALYNQYTGVLRIFMYKTLNASESYTYIALEITYNGNSNLFSLGEQNLPGGVRALDQRDELGNCSFVTINDMGTSYNEWYYIDLNVMYDPVERVGDPSIFIKLYGTEIAEFYGDINLNGQISSTNSSNSNSIIEMGRELYTHYEDGVELGAQIQNILDDQYSGLIDLDLSPHDELFSLITQADIITELLGGSNALYGLFKFITAGGGGSNVSTLIQLHGNFAGTLETINNLRTSNIYESYSGRTISPHYNETMGVFNLTSTPQVEHAEVVYGDITGAHTYRLSSDPLVYQINPECGLRTPPSDLEVALEFEVSFINGYWSWIEEATGYTFDEIIELGCINEISSTWLGNGIRKRYCTQFVPVEDMMGLSFTTPFSANTVSLKVRSIFEKDQFQPSDDVVLMMNFAVDQDQMGETDDIFDFIPPQQLISIYESTVISDQEIDLHNSYSIECNSDLRFENCIININETDYGFNVNHGQLIFNNCEINMTGNFLIANGAESQIILETGTVMNIEDCMIELSDEAHLYLEESELNMTDSHLYLTGSSRVNLTDNSLFTTNGLCEIIGSTVETWYDPVEYFNSPFPPEYGAELSILGDRITFENSLVDFDDETEIKGLDGARWDGIYFLNCSIDCQDPTQCGKLSGSISDLHFLDFQNSNVTVECADISNIGQMKIEDDSHLYIYYLNYHNNIQGIYAAESEVSINSSSIHHNSGNGLTVLNSSYPQTILNSTIYENEGIGLDIHNCFYNLTGSQITDNMKWGYVNLGAVQNLILGDSVIEDNGYGEIAAIADCFPLFHSNVFGIPAVSDANISENPADLFLLMALGPVESPVYVENLLIDLEDESRFFPEFSDFVFIDPTEVESWLSYMEGISMIKVEEYVTAYVMMKNVIDIFPQSDAAEKALSLLPYLYKFSGESAEELLLYVDQLNDPEILKSKTRTKGIIKISTKNYTDAISYFEEIIIDPPGELDQLLAELNEAYCYYQLVNSGERDLPPDCLHKPVSPFQLKTIQSELKNKIFELSGAKQEDVIQPSEIYDVRNYPNPFNPFTSISFQISGNCDNDVKIEIYNIKGQKIKTYDDHPESVEGRQSIIWNGTDDNDQPVPSGIYFYQISIADKIKAVKKCLLLK